MDINLPDVFLKQMHGILRTEYEDFLESLHGTCEKGLRVNTMKITSEVFCRRAPWNMEPVPWLDDAFFPEDGARPARHPYYSAGLFYLQEPSAMTPADRLPVEKGDRILDLCAAPGGKATAVGAKLEGEGLLVANEVNASRAKALLRNIEVFGIRNALVSTEKSADLAKRFPDFFDKILVDAPCSGEGMFRKDPEAVRTWSPEKVTQLSAVQKTLLGDAVSMLRPGGLLMYSTCTFSTEENEDNILWLLENHPEMHVVPIRGYEGFSEGVFDGSEVSRGGSSVSEEMLENGSAGSREGFSAGVSGRGMLAREIRKTVRIWPHKMRGEGHFMALLQKDADCAAPPRHGTLAIERPRGEAKQVLEGFLEQVSLTFDPARIEIRGGKAFFVPELPESAKGIRFLRNGLYLGDLKKGRFEPSEAFARVLSADTYEYTLSFSPEDERLTSFLAGGNIRDGAAAYFPEKCRILVAADGYGLGWGKKIGAEIKNKMMWRTR